MNEFLVRDPQRTDDQLDIVLKGDLDQFKRMLRRQLQRGKRLVDEFFRRIFR